MNARNKKAQLSQAHKAAHSGLFQPSPLSALADVLKTPQKAIKVPLRPSLEVIPEYDKSETIRIEQDFEHDRWLMRFGHRTIPVGEGSFTAQDKPADVAVWLNSHIGPVNVCWR